MPRGVRRGSSGADPQWGPAASSATTDSMGPWRQGRPVWLCSEVGAGSAGASARRYDDAVSPAIRLERSGPGDTVARVTLARPEVHNAFDASVIAELRTTFATLAREEPATLRAVILAGDGPSFCAGADIAWMRAAMSLDV